MRDCLPALVVSTFMALASGQDLRVYSELTRVNTRNEVVRADRAPSHREILSPAVPRNGYSTFRVVVSGPAGTAYTLTAGQNPENAVDLTMYRESYRRVTEEWVPDRIERVSVPYEAKLGDGPDPSQTAQSFLLDLKVDRNAPVRRIKVEPQAWMIDRWMTYPMEVRVVHATVPDGPAWMAGSPEPGLPSDAAVWAVFRLSLCKGEAAPPAAAELTDAAFRMRNAAQELRAMRGWKLMITSTPEWCGGYRAHENGPEWYLRVRDQVWRARE